MAEEDIFHREMRENVLTFPQAVEKLYRDGFPATANDDIYNQVHFEVNPNVVDDPINKPAHYTTSPVEAIDMIEQIVKDYPPAIAWSLGNVIKYIARAPYKGTETADLQKAQWYLARALSHL